MSQRQKSLGRLRNKWGDNIKRAIKGILFKAVD
jgi:hypothetical protein